MDIGTRVKVRDVGTGQWAGREGVISLHLAPVNLYDWRVDFPEASGVAFYEDGLEVIEDPLAVATSLRAHGWTPRMIEAALEAANKAEKGERRHTTLDVEWLDHDLTEEPDWQELLSDLDDVDVVLVSVMS